MRATFYRRQKFRAACKRLFFLIPIFFFNQTLLFSQDGDIDCDEVPVTLIVQHFGRTELPSYVCGENVFFSVPGFFEFLKIKNSISSDFRVVEGFIKDQDDIYKIDESSKTIIYGKKNFEIPETSYIRTKNDLFLKKEYFESIFGFDNEFSARNLSALVNPDFELPAVKLARRKRMQENIRQLQNDFSADTTIARESTLFNFGSASWAVNSTQRTDGIAYSRLNLGLGGLLAGGEFNGNFNYNTDQELTLRNQFYQWRYVNNENSYLRQVNVGKIAARSVSSIFNPVVGVQITNAPTVLKRSFGTYTINDYTQPNWVVELYVNNVLVDYGQADSNGFFSFEVPLIYGSTNVSLRYYGPWGEEEISERVFRIPFNILTPGDFEYSISSGLVEDGNNSKFFQARGHYGLSRNITLGGGVEYLSSPERSTTIPFVNTSVRLPGNMFISGEYLYKIGFRGDFSYTSPSRLRFELNYKKYEENQEVIRFSYLEERKADISFPLNYGKFSGTSRFIFRQNFLRNNSFANMEWLLTGRALGMRLNLSTTAYIQDTRDPLIFSRLSSSIILPGNFMFSPGIEYGYHTNKISAIEGEVRKRIFKRAHIQASYNHNFRFDQYNLNFGINFDFGFSRVNLNSNSNRRYTSFSQSGTGSINFDPTQNYLRFNSRQTLGRGSVKFAPFLDMNANGVKDELEEYIEGVAVHTSGGGNREFGNEGSTLYHGLEPYIHYHFTLDTRNLDRISWQIEHESMKVYINPNKVKLIEVPIKVVGEVAGFVYNENRGLGGMKMNIYNSEEVLLTTVVSEMDGYFSYLGLTTGKYIARIDEGQLKDLGLKDTGDFTFSIENTREGDYVDNLEFKLMEAISD